MKIFSCLNRTILHNRQMTKYKCNCHERNLLISPTKLESVCFNIYRVFWESKIKVLNHFVIIMVATHVGSWRTNINPISHGVSQSVAPMGGGASESIKSTPYLHHHFPCVMTKSLYLA